MSSAQSKLPSKGKSQSPTGSGATTAAGNSNSNSSSISNSSGSGSGQGSQKKKRRFVPPPVPAETNFATAADLRVLHQNVCLSFCYVTGVSAHTYAGMQTSPPGTSTNPSMPEGKWHGRGTTTLYVIAPNAQSTATTSAGTSAMKSEAPFSLSTALHARRTCQVKEVSVELVAKVNAKPALTEAPTSFDHMDPLAHVLLKPPQSYTEDDILREGERYAADSQCSRGANGMMTGLRVASIASLLGELRLAISSPLAQSSSTKLRLTTSNANVVEGSLPPQIKIDMDVADDEAHSCWKADLEAISSISSVTNHEEGRAVQELQSILLDRSAETREARVDWIAQQLVAAGNKRAFKITIHYEIDIHQPHLGGLHCISGPTPVVYSTVGTVGDHEGPRSWLPCLDSASCHHRASRQLKITVTAPMRHGLSVVGCGQDFGTTNAYLHDSEMDENAEKLLGGRHVNWSRSILSNQGPSSDKTSTSPHIIPLEGPDSRSIDSILATCVWCSNAWVPSAPRSLGFAIGPFRVLDDPEYFSIDEDDDDDEPQEAGEEEDDDKPSLEEQLQALEMARKKGEGIRQVYCAPVFARKKLHEAADMSLLPTTDLTLHSLTRFQLEQLKALDMSVISATAGVPHRALSLLRDILALPTYRTISYTQIWIPSAVHGGSTSGALHCCPEVFCNPFLGGAIIDSRLLPPPNCRLPYHGGGRVLQFLQARCAVRGWMTASLPLGGNDDVGNGYIFSLVESFLMSIYERGHGAHGEGGSKQSVFFTKRYAVGSGLNSANLDFLPIVNMEDGDNFEGLGGAVPTDDRNNEQLWRNASNGTESHTSGLDEYNIRQLLIADIVETLERGTDKDTNVPHPSFGWTGSHLALSFLSSTASSSSELGCGAVELAHPIGGMLYRTAKSEVFRRITEGRASTAHFVRVVRAAFIAAHLGDMGETKLKWEDKQNKKQKENPEKKKQEDGIKSSKRPAFVTCVDNLLTKGGLTHSLLTGCLRLLAGERALMTLRGSQVDVARNIRNTATNKQFVDPEGFPNSYIRGASLPYIRVGTHVEAAGADGTGPGGIKGIHLHVMVEPAVPDGGIAFSGPVILRVVENEGQVREFVKDLNNGARADWGPIFLHAKPVTTAKEQANASGVIEAASTSKSKKDKTGEIASEEHENQGDNSVLDTVAESTMFNENMLHSEGYQAIELVRLTNRSPLLWVRVDPYCFFGAKTFIFQPDACLAEMLFHDGDTGAQIEAIRSLAERPLRTQPTGKITAVHNVRVVELPVHLLGDCLRGSPALHGDLPHTPVVRVQAALGIAQWQNNRAHAPSSTDSLDTKVLMGVNLLMQYFKERYYKNGIIMPVKFSRIAVKKNEAEAGASADAAAGKAKGRESDDYVYLDTIRDDTEKSALVSGAELIEAEDDEEHRVRSAVISAIAAVRGKDGMTPPVVLKFLSTVLDAGDVSTVGAMDNKEAETVGSRSASQHHDDINEEDKDIDIQNSKVAKLHYVSSMVIADALLAICSIHASPKVITDPNTGKPIQVLHPIENLLIASQRWLEWELYRERIRSELDRDIQSGVGGNCYDSVAACGVTALSTLAIIRQATTDHASEEAEKNSSPPILGSQFYMKFFDEKPQRPDVTLAACAQAIACVCCAADRFETPNAPIGLLTALEFILQKLSDPLMSVGLRQTLALLMLDVCTGKVSSMKRVAVVGARSDLYTAGAKFYGGPLGASNGSDNGSALLMNVNSVSNPAASAVNDGARRGLRLLSRAGHSKDESKDEIIVRVAKFASDLWRTVNGHRTQPSQDGSLDVVGDGVCANDGILRCSLLALWQWIWPKACYAIMRVQSWRQHEGTTRYVSLGADTVLKVYDEETEAASSEEKSFEAVTQIVNAEIDRQAWRGDMMTKAYEHTMEKKGPSKDDAAIGDLLPPVLRDNAFKSGGWVASTSRQRRAMQLDGGTSVKKIRLTVKPSD